MPASNDGRGGGAIARRSSGYLHSLDGRLRIKLAEVKRAPSRATTLQEQLTAIAGVKEVVANPVTGNVLILYDPALCSREQLFDTLEELAPSAAFLRTNPPDVHYQALEALSSHLLEVAVRSTVEIAVRRLISSVL